jgi:hypothetical protein
MSNTIRPDQLTEAVMERLQKYKDVSTEEMKVAVKTAAQTVKRVIRETAPKDTGKYSKSWRMKTSKNNVNALSMTVYSHKRYMLTHLLEHGHAKRGGGRVPSIPHIAPAEEIGEKLLIEEIERILRG